MPSLMAVHWLGQNSGPIFRRIKFGSVRRLQRRFPIDVDLLRSGDIRDQVVKLRRNLMLLSRKISGRAGRRDGHPNF